jgi:hypothetical protein
MAIWFIRQITARATLSKHLLIEKPYRLNPKLLLYSWKISSYGLTTACPASTLWQT